MRHLPYLDRLRLARTRAHYAGLAAEHARAAYLELLTERVTTARTQGLDWSEIAARLEMSEEELHREMALLTAPVKPHSPSRCNRCGHPLKNDESVLCHSCEEGE